MSIWERIPRIKHVWTKSATQRLEHTLHLYNDGCIPESIAVPMLVTPVRRLLRGIYGSGWKAVCALFILQLGATTEGCWYAMQDFVKFTILRRKRFQGGDDYELEPHVLEEIRQAQKGNPDERTGDS